ncbi:hypothetical protein ACLSSQ_09400 [Azospira sp. APE16]|uniref:hypothetical protein n=1 Tax=Azospira sp. APE16 TaxID=3394231 RepID=UPI003A4E1833
MKKVLRFVAAGWPFLLVEAFFVYAGFTAKTVEGSLQCFGIAVGAAVLLWLLVRFNVRFAGGGATPVSITGQPLIDGQKDSVGNGFFTYK